MYFQTFECLMSRLSRTRVKISWKEMKRRQQLFEKKKFETLKILSNKNSEHDEAFHEREVAKMNNSEHSFSSFCSSSSATSFESEATRNVDSNSNAICFNTLVENQHRNVVRFTVCLLKLDICLLSI